MPKEIVKLSDVEKECGEYIKKGLKYAFMFDEEHELFEPFMKLKDFYETGELADDAKKYIDIFKERTYDATYFGVDGLASDYGHLDLYDVNNYTILFDKDYNLVDYPETLKKYIVWLKTDPEEEEDIYEIKNDIRLDMDKNMPLIEIPISELPENIQVLLKEMDPTSSGKNDKAFGAIDDLNKILGIKNTENESIPIIHLNLNKDDERELSKKIFEKLPENMKKVYTEMLNDINKHKCDGTCDNCNCDKEDE